MSVLVQLVDEGLSCVARIYTNIVSVLEAQREGVNEISSVFSHVKVILNCSNQESILP